MSELKNCWQIQNCSKEAMKSCKVVKDNLGHTCFFVMKDKKCESCQVYSLYNQDSGSLKHQVINECVDEIVKIREILGTVDN